jgi:hypothetical protein
MRFTIQVFLLFIFAALSTAAEQAKIRRYNDIAHYHRGRVVAVTTLTPYGDERVSIQGLDPKIAVYMHHQTKPLPQRAILRGWNLILKFR